MPLDEQGNLVNQAPGNSAVERNLGTIAPPGYGEHVLDQLYEDVDITGYQTPAVRSGVSSPFYAQSRSGSAENISGLTHSVPVAPAALSTMLANVSLDSALQNYPQSTPGHPGSGRVSPTSAPHRATPRSNPTSTNLSRTPSGEDHSERSSAERAQVDAAEFAELNRVPSYSTAVRTPARPRIPPGGTFVPDYQTALSAPRTPPTTDTEHPVQTLAHGAALSMARSHSDDGTTNRRLHVMRARDQAV